MTDKVSQRKLLAAHEMIRTRFKRICLLPLRVRCFALCLLALGAQAAATSNQSKVDFNRDIRPILSENCYKCHGPDDGARKANLRFDKQGEALKPAKSGLIPISAGVPEKSEMVARITTSDLQKHMPPAQSGKKLKENQIDLLRRWIAEGAPYAMHWAYVKPVRPELPEVSQGDWPHNAIDRFILARLEKEGLKPSPGAERHVLIRRVSLDLTGLPPTPEEVKRFVEDGTPGAYEALVDRLLSKPAYGEHWARLWLDLARYADSAGYADDPLRTIWLYRDYVIRAFNQNKPFDRFTIEQIAGDLLPDASEEDRIATAFHRNTMTNHEGGTDDEEFRNAAIVDRVNTTMAVWMATSMACAQCHHHKYDPISQEEYFRFFAIFNNSEDADRDDESPVMKVLTEPQKKEREPLLAEVGRIEELFRTDTPESAAEQVRWEQSFPLEILWQDALGQAWKPIRESQEEAQYAGVPDAVLNILELARERRTDTQKATLSEYYRGQVFPASASERKRRARSRSSSALRIGNRFTVWM